MSKTTGRNDPCPCGSGKKYKACCWKNEQAEKAKTIKFKASSLGSSMGFLSKGLESAKTIASSLKDRIAKVDPKALEAELKEKGEAMRKAAEAPPAPTPPPQEP